MQRMSWRSFAVVAGALVLLAACSSVRAGELQPPPVATLTAEQQALAPAGQALGSLQQGDVIAWLTSQPTQPVKGTGTIDAYLVDNMGRPITDATVTFDTDMTNMSHGLYLVTAEAGEPGHYWGELHFSMPGPWRVIAIVERPGREPARLRFEFSVKTR